MVNNKELVDFRQVKGVLNLIELVMQIIHNELTIEADDLLFGMSDFNRMGEFKVLLIWRRH